MTIHLAGERKQVLVDELRGLAVPLVLLGLFDVLVNITLRLESLSTALIRARERSFAGVVHEVILQALMGRECCRAAWMGAGESSRLGVLAAEVTPQVTSLRKSCSAIFLVADKRTLAQVHAVVVAN